MVGKRTINETDTETENVDPQSNKKPRNVLKITETFEEKKTDEKMPTRDVN
jgi:hypothetical protein